MTEWAWASAGERCRTTLQAWRKCGDHRPPAGTQISNVFLNFFHFGRVTIIHYTRRGGSMNISISIAFGYKFESFFFVFF